MSRFWGATNHRLEAVLRVSHRPLGLHALDNVDDGLGRDVDRA